MTFIMLNSCFTPWLMLILATDFRINISLSFIKRNAPLGLPLILIFLKSNYYYFVSLPDVRGWTLHSFKPEGILIVLIKSEQLFGCWLRMCVFMCLPFLLLSYFNLIVCILHHFMLQLSPLRFIMPWNNTLPIWWAMRLFVSNVTLFFNVK